VTGGDGGATTSSSSAAGSCVSHDSSRREPVLDIVDRVLHHEERGLLGLAFHPSFSQNGRFFVTYSRRDDGATSVSEFTLAGKLAVPQEGAASDAPRPSETTERPRPVEATERPLLVIAQPYTTHKGGMLAFDAHGKLLIGTGDGGSGDDPDGHALTAGHCWANCCASTSMPAGPTPSPPTTASRLTRRRARDPRHGLRNPRRFSVDRASGDGYIGDVGQSGWEEVDVLARGARATSFG
jgi:glucose/arabinose dehydrogenase